MSKSNKKVELGLGISTGVLTGIEGAHFFSFEKRK